MAPKKTQIVPTPKIITTEMLFDSINKDFGKGSIGLLTDDTRAQILFWASTGIYTLDDAMSWGLPGGRWVEFFGAESSGKTTAMMAAFIENERNGGINAAFDAEGTFDQDRYKQMGGDPSKVIMIDPGTMEQFYDKLKRVVAWAKYQEVPDNACVLIGIDSMPMLVPKAVLELEGNEELVAVQSRINARHMPTVDKMLGANTCILLLNQVRDKIGSMAWSQEGNIETPGGRIIKHICSVRVLFNKSGQIDNGKTKDERRIIGMKTEAKVVKSKIGPPFRKAAYRIMFDHRGVDNVNHVLEACVANKLIKAPNKGVYTVKDVQFKKDSFYQFLASHPKWTRWALAQTFDLYHDGVDLRRYLKNPMIKEIEASTE